MKFWMGKLFATTLASIYIKSIFTMIHMVMFLLQLIHSILRVSVLNLISLYWSVAFTDPGGRFTKTKCYRC